jgi:hypothetical protein
MPMSTDELSALSDADVLNLQIQNRNWGKDIRRSLAELVDSRLANLISHEEYTVSRQAAKVHRTECERMITALSAELKSRSMERKP